MPRKNLIRTNYYPYHVTIRTNNKEWFDLPMEEVWRLCKKNLKIASSKVPVEIISFVLMQNHYHLLIQTPNSNLDLFMYEFNKNLSLDIRNKTQRINKIFGGRYKWCLVNNDRYFANCYRYIYQNPTRAGLSSKCENYPYSTLFYLTKNKNFSTTLYDRFGFKDHYGLEWLNEHIDEKELRAIKSSLKKPMLGILKDPISRVKI